MQIEAGQTYFQIDPITNSLKLAYGTVTPESFGIPPFAERITGIRAENIRLNEEEIGVYPQIISHWFKGRFGPDMAIQTVYRVFLEKDSSLPTYRSLWSQKQREVKLGELAESDLDSELVDGVIKLGIARNPKEAIQLIGKGLDLFEGIAGDLDEYLEWRYEYDSLHNYDYYVEVMPPQGILLYDEHFPRQFRRQLMFAGIFTSTQFYNLTDEQIEQIKKNRVPRSFKIHTHPHPNDFLYLLGKLEDLT